MHNLRLLTRAVGLLGVLTVAALFALASPAIAVGSDRYEPDGTALQAKWITPTLDAVPAPLQMHTFHSKTDVDYVKFSAKRGARYSLSLWAGEQRQSYKVVFYRYEKSSRRWRRVWTAHIESAMQNYLPYKAPSTGTYALRITREYPRTTTARYGISLVRGAVKVTPDESDPGDSQLASATPIVPIEVDEEYSSSDLSKWDLYTNQFLLRSTRPTDTDFYRFEIEPNRWYWIRVYMGSWTTRGVEICTYGEHYGSNGEGEILDGLWAFGAFSPVDQPTVGYFSIRGATPFWYRLAVIETPR
jgi:hypothetical protein